MSASAERLFKIPELRKRYFELFYVGEGKREYWGSPVVLANHVDFDQDDNELAVDLSGVAPSKDFSPMGFLRCVKEGSGIHLLMHDKDVSPEFDILWDMITSINIESELESKWDKISLGSMVTVWRYIKYFNIRFTDGIFISWIKKFWDKLIREPFPEEYLIYASELLEIIQVGIKYFKFDIVSPKEFLDLVARLDKIFIVKFNKKSLLFLARNIGCSMHVQYNDPQDSKWMIYFPASNNNTPVRYSYKKHPIICWSVPHLIRTYILAGEIQIVNSEEFKREISADGKISVGNIEWHIDIESINCCVDEIIGRCKKKSITGEEMKRMSKFYNLSEDIVKYAIWMSKIPSKGYGEEYCVYEIFQYAGVVKRITGKLGLKRLNVRVDCKGYKLEVLGVNDNALEFCGIQANSIIELISVVANSKHAKFLFGVGVDFYVRIKSTEFSISEFKYLLDKKSVAKSPPEIFRMLSCYLGKGIFSFTEIDVKSIYDVSGLNSDGSGIIAIPDDLYNKTLEDCIVALKYNFFSISKEKYMLALYLSGYPDCIRFDSKYFMTELELSIEKYNQLSKDVVHKYLSREPILASSLVYNQPSEPDEDTKEEPDPEEAFDLDL